MWLVQGVWVEVMADLAGHVGTSRISVTFEHKLAHVVKGHSSPHDHDPVLSQGCESLSKLQMLLQTSRLLSMVDNKAS